MLFIWLEKDWWCGGIKSNLDTIFGLSVATTISSGAGTVTLSIANKRVDKTVNCKNKEYEQEKTKALNMISNILAGGTMGTSITSTTLSAVQISKAKKDSNMAENVNCL